MTKGGINMVYSGKSFIEVQFPVSKVSKESFKERKANLGQTLTGLGEVVGQEALDLGPSSFARGCYYQPAIIQKRTERYS